MADPVYFDDGTRGWVRFRAYDFIADAYRAWRSRPASSLQREPALTVGVITDYIRQCAMPDELKFAGARRQYALVRRQLEMLVDYGYLEKSLGLNERGRETVMYGPTAKRFST